VYPVREKYARKFVVGGKQAGEQELKGCQFHVKSNFDRRVYRRSAKYDQTDPLLIHFFIVLSALNMTSARKDYASWC